MTSTQCWRNRTALVRSARRHTTQRSVSITATRPAWCAVFFAVNAIPDWDATTTARAASWRRSHICRLPVAIGPRAYQMPTTARHRFAVATIYPPEHDPEKLQTFRIRSCDRTNTESEIAIQCEAISL